MSAEKDTVETRAARSKHDKQCPFCQSYINSKGFLNHVRKHSDTSCVDHNAVAADEQLVKAIEARVIQVYRDTCKENPTIVEQGLESILQAILRHYQQSRTNILKAGASA